MLLCVPLWSAVNRRQVFSEAPINLPTCPPDAHGDGAAPNAHFRGRNVDHDKMIRPEQLSKPEMCGLSQHGMLAGLNPSLGTKGGFHH